MTEKFNLNEAEVKGLKESETRVYQEKDFAKGELAAFFEKLAQLINYRQERLHFQFVDHDSGQWLDVELDQLAKTSGFPDSIFCYFSKADYGLDNNLVLMDRKSDDSIRIKLELADPELDKEEIFALIESELEMFIVEK
jgi:hypothetical protein